MIKDIIKSTIMLTLVSCIKFTRGPWTVLKNVTHTFRTAVYRIKVGKHVSVIIAPRVRTWEPLHDPWIHIQ